MSSAFQTRAQLQQAADYAEALHASRAVQGGIALRRLAHEVRDCRALGCALAWKIDAHPDLPGQWLFSLVLPSQAVADRLEETLHGAD